MFNYRLICYQKLLGDISDRQREVILRRFGLRAAGGEPRQGRGEKETLEAIGRAMGITRERVRQIEKDGLERLRRRGQTICSSVFQYFRATLKKNGNLKREDLLLELLGDKKFKNYVFFLLTLGKDFERVSESDLFYPFWTIDNNSLVKAQKVINRFISELKKKNQPLPRPDYALPSYLEISKVILLGPQGLYGLPEWPEVNPRGARDKAYLVLRKEKRPLHFREVATFANWDCVQTIHNELIKDDRFVLVGRGLYALKEWGYQPGTVREVITNILAESKQPLSKEKVVREVLKQRQVQPNTILLNLQNKKYFIKKTKGYTLREV